MWFQNNRLLRANVILMVALLSNWCPSLAQERTSDAWRLDQFGNIGTDSEQARLDRFATELSSRSDTRGVIIGYRSSDLPRGFFLRMLHGYEDYLVNKRGISPDRLMVTEGGFKTSFAIELWIAPAKAASPIISWKPAAIDRSPVSFDDYSTTDSGHCIGEYSIYLYKIEDALTFFAEALREDAGAKAAIVVHPSYHENRSKIASLVKNSVDSLNRLGISSQRILTTVGKRYAPKCTYVNLWLAPGSSVKADEAGYYAALMRDAEAKEYTVRRVEFTGDTHIRDSILRRQLVQQEGDVFSRKLLEKSLRNFGRLGLVYPVTLDDVAVSLADEERLIDITIAFREIPGAWRRSVIK